MVGNLKTIRSRAQEVATMRHPPAPRWRFTSDRQGWFYAGVGTYAGWPIRGELDLRPDGKTPLRALSPLTFWLAEQAPTVTIEAAISGEGGKATLTLSKHPLNTDGTDIQLSLPLVTDGQMRRLVIPIPQTGYDGAYHRATLTISAQTISTRVKSIELGK